MTAKLDLVALHKKSRLNRALLAEAAVCGCFYCLRQFRYDQVAEWVDDGGTALCPYCGIDAVLGFPSEPADEKLLRQMHERWFEQGIQLTAEEWAKAVETNQWPARMTHSKRQKS